MEDCRFITGSLAAYPAHYTSSRIRILLILEDFPLPNLLRIRHLPIKCNAVQNPRCYLLYSVKLVSSVASLHGWNTDSKIWKSGCFYFIHYLSGVKL